MPNLTRHFWSRFWPYGFLAVLVLLFFGETIFQKQVFFWRDIYQMHTWPPYSGTAIQGKEWFPLWNPFLGGGKPYFAECESAMLYPLNWFHLFLSPIRALMATTVLQMFLFGASIYALCRHWKFTTFPALLAAIGTMFGTLVLAAMDARAPFAAMVWGPLELLLVSLFIERWRAGENKTPWIAAFWKNIHFVLILACVIAIQYLGGFPQMMFNILLLVGLFAICRALSLRDWRLLLATGAAFALSGVIALGLTMIQFLPTLELIGQSSRGQAIDPRQEMASFHPRHLLNMLLPFLFGKVGYPQEYWAGTIFEFWAGTCYIGIFPLLMIGLAPLTVLPRTGSKEPLHRFLFWFFAGTAAFSLLMAAGQHTPFYMFFYKMVPGFSHFRWPSKFLQIFIYSTAVFSALGFQALLESRTHSSLVVRRWLVVFFVVCVILLLAAFVCSLFGAPAIFSTLTAGTFINTPEHLASGRVDLWRLTVCLLIAIALSALLLWKQASVFWISLGCVILTFVNLMSVDRAMYPITSDRLYEEGPDLAPYQSALQDQLLVLSQYNAIAQFVYGSGNTENIKWTRMAAAGNMLQPHGIFEAYQDGLGMLRWQTLFGLIWQLPPAQAEKIADIMSVGYFVRGNDFQQVFWGGASKALSIIKRPNCLPRAYLVSQWSVLENPNEILQRLISDGFNPSLEALVEPLAGMSELKSTIDYDWYKPPGQVLGPIRHTWNSAEVTLEANRDAMLVTTETWFPGWKAFVDGKPVPIYRVNYNYRGVFVGAGKHHVLYKYDPWKFKLGAAISLATFLFVIAVLIIRTALNASNKRRKTT